MEHFEVFEALHVTLRGCGTHVFQVRRRAKECAEYAVTVVCRDNLRSGASALTLVMKPMILRIALLLGAVHVVMPLHAATKLPAKIEFNRDVRPILSDNCFYCHGPDKDHREADMRLDIREEA